ncbi:MAG: cytidine and deoxycytidylate deaminase zinc-binding region family protein [Capsulimonas sp.]|nr:cytidine and deoxycytidylate deaminase zinc-binding region family protein [Capsulimonas sp.]
MREALAEGRKALPDCLPNPPAGCVFVKDNTVIARGFTNPPGSHHAEAMALSQVSGPLTDVTAYVTLEPCSFQGRTPSCAMALAARDVSAVYVALIDPDQRNHGKGIAILRQSGIAVTVGLLREEAERDLKQYLI